jgi:hypothetical protein
MKPVGPSISVKLRFASTIQATGGVAAACINIGGVIVGLTDFTNSASLFARFTITNVKVIVLPYAGFVSGTYRGPMALGYYNDGSAVSTPAGFG